MICVSCGGKAGYYRAVIDTVYNSEIGGLCKNCAVEHFGKTLDIGHFNAKDGCLLCERDGYLALPIWEAEVSDSQLRKTVFTNKYEITSNTPKLCDSHADQLFPELDRQLSKEISQDELESSVK